MALIACAGDESVGVVTIAESYALYAGGKLGIIQDVCGAGLRAGGGQKNAPARPRQQLSRQALARAYASTCGSGGVAQGSTAARAPAPCRGRRVDQAVTSVPRQSIGPSPTNWHHPVQVPSLKVSAPASGLAPRFELS